MDKKITRKKASVKPDRDTSADNPDINNVDKIRDLLVGNQLRDFDDKLEQLEEQISGDLASIRQENALQMESLKTFIESEIDILASKLAGEEKSRITDMDELQAELQKTAKKMDEKFTQTGKSLDSQSRDINQKILKQSQDFTTEMNAQIEQTRKRMDTYKQQLSSSKVDRSGLAEMLNTLALQINADEPDKAR